MAAAWLTAGLIPGLLPRPLAQEALGKGMTVIPTLARRWGSRQSMLETRAEMMERGLYPGVDYTISEVSEEGATLTLRPAYALVQKLERDDWPITVRSDLAPNWFTPEAYNSMVAGIAVLIAAGWIAAGVSPQPNQPGCSSRNATLLLALTGRHCSRMLSRSPSSLAIPWRQLLCVVTCCS
ncbi:MAG: hypothetical protein SGPRY_010078 [Prymnesium sp.]